MPKVLQIPVLLIVAAAMLAAVWLLIFGAAWIIDHVGIYTFCWVGLGIAASVFSWGEAKGRSWVPRNWSKTLFVIMLILAAFMLKDYGGIGG
jgi:hypothetical protein